MRFKLYPLLLFLFLLGCGVATQESVSSPSALAVTPSGLEDVSLNFTQSLHDLREGFITYDLKYPSLILWNSVLISDQALSAMESQTQDISLAIIRARTAQSSFDALKATLDVQSLSPESQELYSLTEQQSTAFQEINPSLDTCLLSLQEYNAYMHLYAEWLALSDTESVQESLIDQYFYAEQYSDAKETINALQKTFDQMIINLEKRQDLGLENITDDYIASWEEYSAAYGAYGSYISEQEKWGYTEDAYVLELEMHERFASSLSDDLVDPATERLTALSLWYTDSIIPCTLLLP